MNKNFSLKKSGQLFVIFMVVIGLLTIAINRYLINDAKSLENRTRSMDAAEHIVFKLQFHVVQIQQFLTDVSATGDRDGLADAQEHYDLAIKSIEAANLILPEYSKEFEVIRTNLDAYYNVGKRMAEAYVTEGQKAGNAIMQQPNIGFDSRSEVLVGSLDKVALPVNRATTEMSETLHHTLEKIGWLTIVVSALVSLIVLCVSMFFIKRLINTLGGEPMEVATIAHNIANGMLQAQGSKERVMENTVLAALKQASETILRIDTEMARMDSAHKAGDINAEIDASQFKGEYRNMVLDINHLVDFHVEILKNVSRSLHELSQGDLDAQMLPLPGELALVNKSFDALKNNVRTLIRDMDSMAEAHELGETDVMLDETKFAGDFSKVALEVLTLV